MSVLIDEVVTAEHTAQAWFDPTRRFRYLLSREWTPGPQVLFVMLNPSTADAFKLDPTVTRCANLARREGFGGFVVCNLFALRATDPRVMRRDPEPVGGTANDNVIVAAAMTTKLVVVAWGTHGTHLGRDRQVLDLLTAAGVAPYRLGPPTKDGHPRHPLYLPADVRLEPHDPKGTT